MFSKYRTTCFSTLWYDVMRFLALIMELFAECGGVCNDVNILGMIKSAKIVSSELCEWTCAAQNRILDFLQQTDREWEQAEENR